MVNEGTTGTQIRITGSDFGLKKGKVLLGAGGKTKLKIAKGDWTDDTIIGTVSKVPLPAGSYPAPFEVMIQTKHKPPQSLHYHRYLYRDKSGDRHGTHLW